MSAGKYAHLYRKARAGSPVPRPSPWLAIVLGSSKVPPHSTIQIALQMFPWSIGFGLPIARQASWLQQVHTHLRCTPLCEMFLYYFVTKRRSGRPVDFAMRNVSVYFVTKRRSGRPVDTIRNFLYYYNLFFAAVPNLMPRCSTHPAVIVHHPKAGSGTDTDPVLYS